MALFANIFPKIQKIMAGEEGHDGINHLVERQASLKGEAQSQGAGRGNANSLKKEYIKEGLLALTREVGRAASATLKSDEPKTAEIKDNTKEGAGLIDSIKGSIFSIAAHIRPSPDQALSASIAPAQTTDITRSAAMEVPEQDASVAASPARQPDVSAQLRNDLASMARFGGSHAAHMDNAFINNAMEGNHSDVAYLRELSLAAAKAGTGLTGQGLIAGPSLDFSSGQWKHPSHTPTDPVRTRNVQIG